jgi:tetratricopeptide (TPR) repeat protein
MDRSEYRLILFMLLLLSSEIKASYRSEIYSAYVNNQMNNWKNVIERIDTIQEKSDELLLELINYQYGYIGYCAEFGMKDEAKNYLNIAQKNVEILEKRSYKLAAVNSYKAAFYGFRIGLNPISALVNAPKSMDCAKEALRLDPGYYFACVQLGNIKFHLPSAFGGSKEEAVEYYLKARILMEMDPESLSGDWNYLSLLTLIGQTYTYLKDYASAKKSYEEILKLEPGFIYVKDDLYPKLLKEMENQANAKSVLITGVETGALPKGFKQEK